MRLLLTLAILSAVPFVASAAQAGNGKRSDQTSARSDFIGAARDTMGGHRGRRVVGNPDPIYLPVPEYDSKTGCYGPCTPRPQHSIIEYRWR